MKTAPRKILILNCKSPGANPSSIWALNRSLKRWQVLKKKTLTAPLGLIQENGGPAPQVSNNSAVRTPLRQLKQRGFCWPFNSSPAVAKRPTSTTSSIEIPSCETHSTQQCPRLTGDLRSLNCLNITFKQASSFISSWLKVRKLNISTPSQRGCVENIQKLWKTNPKRIWEKLLQFSARKTSSRTQWLQSNKNSSNSFSIH